MFLRIFLLASLMCVSANADPYPGSCTASDGQKGQECPGNKECYAPCPPKCVYNDPENCTTKEECNTCNEFIKCATQTPEDTMYWATNITPEKCLRE